MKTASLKTRVTAAILALLVVVLAGVVAAVTIAYRSSLDRDLRHQLRVAATEFRYAPANETTKVLVSNLSRQGIAVEFEPGSGALPGDKLADSGEPPVKVGSAIRRRGSLVVLDQVLPDGAHVTLTASNSRIGHAVRRLLAIEIAVALVSLALAGLVIGRVTRTALRPLEQVSQTAARIAGGETSERLQPTRADTELGSMAAAFDRMVDALAAAVSDAKQAEETMRRFVADASHELRTPVAALQASAETLLREQPDRPRRDTIEATLARDAARLGNLVDDLLGLARLEAQQPGRPEPIEFGVLARAAIARSEHETSGTRISLTRDVAVHVRGDPEALSRLMRNLLDNALTATGPGGRIDVHVTAYGDQARISVSDDGPGVPSSDRERIFDRFARLTPNDAAGTGLGLAIARRIAHQHDGDLTCDLVDHGARFTLRLPLAKAPAAP